VLPQQSRSQIQRLIKNGHVRLEGRLLSDMLGRLWDRLEGLDRLLESLSYEQVLARGFALVRDAGGRPLLRAQAVEPGTALNIEFADGRVDAVADGAAPARPKPARRTAPVSKDQGNLW